MAVFSIGRDGKTGIGAEVCDIFGLKECRDLKILFPLDGAVTVVAEFFPNMEQMEKIKTILKRYHLEEVKDGE